MPPKRLVDLQNVAKPVKLSKSQILRQQRSDLKGLTDEYMRKKKKAETELRNLTRPLTRVSSLPVIYRHRLVKQLFSVSKSIDFGFEPPIPGPENATIILDELPDNKTNEIKEIKKLPVPPPGSIKTPPFSVNTTIDNRDLKSLDNVKTDDHRSFIKKKVGKKKLNKILNVLDPLGEDSVEIPKVEQYRAMRRRFLLCFVLPIVLALCVWIALFIQVNLSNGNVPQFDRPVTPPVPPNAKPYEYLPRPKSFNRVIPILASFMFCEKKAPGINTANGIIPSGGRQYDQIANFYLNKIRFVVSSLSNAAKVQGTWVVKSMEVVNDKLKIEVFLFPRYYQVCPGLLWLGMDFGADLPIIKRQLVIFANEVLFVEISNLYDVECSLQSEDIIDRFVKPFKDVGQLYGELLVGVRPNNLPGAYEGIIRRRLQEELGITIPLSVRS